MIAVSTAILTDRDCGCHPVLRTPLLSRARSGQEINHLRRICPPASVLLTWCLNLLPETSPGRSNEVHVLLIRCCASCTVGNTLVKPVISCRWFCHDVNQSPAAWYCSFRLTSEACRHSHGALPLWQGSQPKGTAFEERSSRVNDLHVCAKAPSATIFRFLHSVAPIFRSFGSFNQCAGCDGRG